ncbi:hypothetical protein BDR07DRAFT_1493597 [Suillus spraguei]|nr:hypothetical protein BDR07DRAFT_1493597 [Suillus spraguei]
MPLTHQHAHCAAHLKATILLCLRAMDDEGSTSRGPLKPSEPPGPQLVIQWQSDQTLTDTLVNYLTTHPTDCRVLFYSNRKKAMTASDDGPSGSDKGQIHSTLARLIFTDHPKYSAAYSTNPTKFHDAVCNHIGILRTKYKRLKATFNSTGAGVMQTDETQVKNLLDAALLDLPWYTELDAIWHSNPSMAAKTYSSKLALVTPHTLAPPPPINGPLPLPHIHLLPALFPRNTASNISPHVPYNAIAVAGGYLPPPATAVAPAPATAP